MKEQIESLEARIAELREEQKVRGVSNLTAIAALQRKLAELKRKPKTMADIARRHAK
jgi:hypothetical protein